MNSAIAMVNLLPQALLSPSLAAIHHIILDRDGVLNEEMDAKAFVTKPRDFRWLPGALQALVKLRAMGMRVSVATNQSGIARGVLSEFELNEIHETMSSDARAAGGSIDAIFYCPHGPDEQCTCRKPAPGLILAALSQSGISGGNTLVIGDAARDLEAARSAGAHAALVRTGKGRQFEEYALDRGFLVFDDLGAIATQLSNAASQANDEDLLQGIFADHIVVATEAAKLLVPILAACIRITRQCLRSGNKILVCGNGGSAADAQHFVAELVGRYNNVRPALSAIALGTDAATTSAVSNDFGFDQVFARQVEALGRQGDVVIALSTSGNSRNVINAAISARGRGCVVIALTGRTGGELLKHADVALRVPTDSVARVQEVHELCLHSLAQALDSTACSLSVE
jgi:phosphoheptose isomerase